MMNNKEIGTRIAVLRKGMGDSQAKLAERLDVSPQAVSKWETGQSLPDIGNLLKLSWLFRTSINHILEGSRPVEAVSGVDRKNLLLDTLLRCPQCRSALRLTVQNGRLAYGCTNRHAYDVVDGVVDFKTREIPGEQWSLSYRNYEAYLTEHRLPGNPNYRRGIDSTELIWKILEAQRPEIILDMACGTGQGIKQQLGRINWPVTILMADISHRILKWNSRFYDSEVRNPFVDMVYLACDGANLPIRDGTIDCVFSYGGFESMQAKMTDGLREAFRVLRSDGCVVYTKDIIEDHDSQNSQKWMELLLADLNGNEAAWVSNALIDLREWIQICEKNGFSENTYKKMYGELPAPDTDRFPFENEIAQWMAAYVFVSRKP